MEKYIAPILVASAVCMTVEMLWYGTSSCARWFRFLGGQERGIGHRNRTRSSLFFGFLSLIVTNTIIAYLFTYVPFLTVSSAILFGVLIFFGFYVPVHLRSILWYEKPRNLFYVHSGYYLVTLVLASLIIGLW